MRFTAKTFFFWTRLKTNEGNQISLSVTRTIPLPRKSGSREEPHAQPALCWRRLESTVSPATTWQTPSQQYVSTKPRGLGPSRLPEQSRLWPWTKHSGSWQSRPTISLRLRLQGRPKKTGSPADSGHVLSFFLRASSRAAPLWSAALLRAVPSRLRGDTNVVSMASWAPSKRVNPSTTISSLRASVGFPPSNVKVSHHDVCRNTSPSFSANLRCGPLQCKSPCSEDPRLRARCSMVATAVEETATSAGTGEERQWEVEATTQQNPERLWIDPR